MDTDFKFVTQKRPSTPHRATPPPVSLSRRSAVQEISNFIPQDSKNPPRPTYTPQNRRNSPLKDLSNMKAGDLNLLETTQSSEDLYQSMANKFNKLIRAERGRREQSSGKNLAEISFSKESFLFENS